MKKIFVLCLCLVILLGLVACKDEDGNEEGQLDDNSALGADGDDRIDPSLDPNYTEGLNYEYDGDWGYNKTYKKPGLYNPDGSRHSILAENESNGMRHSVVMYGAVADRPEIDNTPALKNAVAAAKEGDYIYFPAGRYYFSSNALTTPYFAHIYLYTSGVNICGAGADKTFLVSKFAPNDNLTKNTALLAIMNASNVTVSGLSFTAEVPEENMPHNLDTTLNNPNGNQYAPVSQIVVLGADPSEATKNIVIKDCNISYFQSNGVLLNKTQDSTVKDCVISNATDIGGGGAGYGILLRGDGFESFSFVGTNLDSRYNIIMNNKINGPFIRHSIILSYVTHNNLIYNNYIDGCQDEPLDLHGEDEFLNVITQNTVKNVTRGAIGLGNPGSTHDATGPGNVIYGNDITNASGGLQITYGTPDTQVYNNSFTNLKENSIGINITFGPNTTIRNNVIDTIEGNNSIGIAGYYSYVYYDPAAGISRFDIQNNQIKNVATAMYFQTYSEGTKIKNNIFTNCKAEIVSDLLNFELPPESDYFKTVEGTVVYPTQEGNVNRGNYTSVINPSGYYYFKGSHEEPEFNRVIYEQYDISQDLLNSSSKVYIRITTTSKAAKQYFYLWAAEDLIWDASEITWGNAPYLNNITNNSELSIDPTGLYPTNEYPYASQLYDPNGECKAITSFQCVSVNEAFDTYYIDITDFMKNHLTSTNFTVIMTNESMDGAYSSVRNMIGNPENVWPCLIFVK